MTKYSMLESEKAFAIENGGFVSAGVAGKSEIEFVRVIQKDIDSGDDNQEYFAIGTTITEGRGTMKVDFGEGRKTHSAECLGSFLNAPAHQHIWVDGEVELVLMGVPMEQLANLLHIDSADLVNAFRPLHERVITTDPMVRPLAMTMWQASQREGNDLFLDQSLQTLSLYMLNLARGNSWGQAAFRENDGLSAADKISSDLALVEDKRILRAIDYIEAHLGEPLSVTTLASVAAMSNSQFSRAFKSTMGEAAWAFVRRRRLERAKLLLETTDELIANIAYKCGFSSQSHLTTSFSHIYKTTPQALRDQRRQKVFGAF